MAGDMGRLLCGPSGHRGQARGVHVRVQYLEIGGYEQLKHVARRAGDETTASMADSILDEERTAAQRIEGMFDAAVTAALESVGVAPSR